MSDKELIHHSSVKAPVWVTALTSLLTSPLLWGIVGTGGFYLSVPYLPWYREQATRYFCSHPLEYALVGLFCIGLSILTVRFLQLIRERRALASNLLGPLDQTLETESDLPTRIKALDKALHTVPSGQSDTMLVVRCRNASDFLKTRQSARGLEEHLKYLADTAVERLYDSYSLLLTINWAVPIIGFLGTVVGITLAIANVTPEQLDTSLNNVTGGLAVAFDTTTVAMSFSLVLVFAYDWIKRSEQRVLSRVEQISLRQLLPRFIDDEQESDPVHQAQTTAAKQLLDRTESLIHDQTNLWRDSMESLRERWSETLDTQQQELSTQLQGGVESTLSEHASQLEQVRHEFLSAFEKVSAQIQESLVLDADRREQQDAQSQAQQQELWSKMHDGLQEVVRVHDARHEDMLDGLSERMQQWQASIEQSSHAVETQLQTLAEYTSQLARLSEQGEELRRVERQLTDNLEAVRAAETFEETLHNLTAAVHMLTARARPKAA